MGPPFPQTLLVQLAHRLRDPGPLVRSSVQWLDEQAARDGKTMEDYVGREHQRQAAMNVTVRNIITSMRQISAIDWAEVFERVSLVDEMLRSESAFATMDFHTRDAYRQQIENVARYSAASELEVTRHALVLSREPDEAQPRRREPGYYLIGAGLPELRRGVGFRPGPAELVRSALRHLGPGGYMAVLGVGTALALAAALTAVAGPGINGFLILLVAILGLIPASELAGGIINRLLAAGLRSKALPALDFQHGIPDEASTLVVVPALLTSRAAVDELIAGLEVHYLGNADANVSFAILSDWRDAPQESLPDDAELLAAAAEGIAELNFRHPRRGEPRFYLMHRRRQWNGAQGAWMGWERKRGKLQELNRFLREETDTSFVSVDGEPPVLPAGVRYVVTLDADTRLPRDTVVKLVGRMAHPLNRPDFVEGARRVVDGYGIIQPRVTMSLPMKAGGSWFQKIFSGSPGLDPYAAPVSDLYQDLFSEGSFVGKGIYDIDAVEGAMAARTPDNAILSHDLFEGIFARAGLASDIEVVEEFPRRYDVAASRMHRWARGDWQLLPWIAHGSGGERKPAGTPLLGWWKMFDNLRRTLAAPTAVAALLAGWLLPPHATLVWSLFIVATIAIPPIASSLIGFSWRSTVSWRYRLDELGTNIWLGLLQSGFLVVTLVHQAGLMLDAIARTLWRLGVSRRRLLEWVTAEQTSRAPEMSVAAYYRWMAASVVVAGLGAVIAFTTGPLTGLVALPFVVAWAAAPTLVFVASRPRPDRRTVALTEEEATNLRLIARQTWRFFERFVTPEDNMLPPGQLPGAAAIGGRASHIADQYRALPAVGRFSARLRMDRPLRDARSAGSDARHYGPDAPLPGPFLQLVRHDRSSTARSAICLDSGQRQPCRPPHCARECLRGGDRRLLARTTGDNGHSRSPPSSPWRPVRPDGQGMARRARRHVGSARFR